jgi:hypothetical protein
MLISGQSNCCAVLWRQVGFIAEANPGETNVILFFLRDTCVCGCFAPAFFIADFLLAGVARAGQYLRVIADPEHQFLML